VKFAFIDEKKVAFPIAVLCRALGVSRRGYDDWLANPFTERDRRRADLERKAAAVPDDVLPRGSCITPTGAAPTQATTTEARSPAPACALA
jgi:hypothetical protein